MAGRLASVISSWSRQFARRSYDFGCGASTSGKYWTTASAGAHAADAAVGKWHTSRRLFSAPLCTLRFDSGWSEFRRQHFGGGIQHRVYSTGQKIPGGPSDSVPEVFGDLTAQSEVTDDVLDSLIALKDFGDIQGLPPLDVILDEDVEADKKAQRRELERKKQLELDSKRVKTVDELGRAYATGRRKASTARVWLKEGEGKMVVNGRPHDLYFPDIDQRLQLLEPFWETNQLGVFDVRATVKGGGVSGQSGALRHGISKALQLYDPTLRPSLKSAGMLTRDSRVVERKKPGKAKARKSYQWVKR